MELTPYESGTRSPAELFAPETRRNIIERRGDPRPKGVPDTERRRRQELAIRVLNRHDSKEALARVLGTTGGSISKWFTGARPVPDKYVESLEEMGES